MMKTLNACKVGMALTAAAFLGMTTAQPAAAITFSLTDLGTLGGNYSSASAINKLGQVVGTSSTADRQSYPFFWDKNSGMVNLGNLGDNVSYPSAINDLGQVIGGSTTADGQYHTFLWEKSRGMTNLGTLGSFSGYTIARTINNLGQIIGHRFGDGKEAFFWEQNTGRIDLWTIFTFPSTYSSANAINNLGQVVGTAAYYYQRDRAFLWEKGSGIRYLGTLGGRYGSANDINDLGQVVGESTTADGKRRAFFWDKNGGMINLGTLGGYYHSLGYFIDDSSATAINDSGQVIGNYATADRQNRAFFWDKSSGMINLGTLGAYNSDNYSNPIAINKLGQVIGSSTSPNGQNRPFFWDKNSGMRDLNDLISDLGWTLDNVVGIDNAGQIVGNGLYNGQRRAFLLTPNTSKSVPESSSALGFLALGAVGAGALAKRK